jgi:hypothetical protein
VCGELSGGLKSSEAWENLMKKEIVKERAREVLKAVDEKWVDQLKAKAFDIAAGWVEGEVPGSLYNGEILTECVVSAPTSF